MKLLQNNGSRSAEATGGSSNGSADASTGGSSEVFTPRTERRLESLPAMLGAPAHDVYLGGAFPVSNIFLYLNVLTVAF